MSDDAGAPDIQYFAEDGTWIKPPGAGRVTVVLKGGNSTLGEAGSSTGGNGGGGASFGNHVHGGGGGQIAAAPAHGAYDGELVARSLRAGAMPAHADVRVGEGGFALIVTHPAGV